MQKVLYPRDFFLLGFGSNFSSLRESVIVIILLLGLSKTQDEYNTYIRNVILMVARQKNMQNQQGKGTIKFCILT